MTPSGLDALSLLLASGDPHGCDDTDGHSIEERRWTLLRFDTSTINAAPSAGIQASLSGKVPLYNISTSS